VSTRWFELCGRADPTGIVVCLPYAGGSGRAFRSWRDHLPPGWALALVDLPGHGRRTGQPCLRSAEPVVAGLLDALADLPAAHRVVLGYSLAVGALLGAVMAWAILPVLQTSVLPEELIPPTIVTLDPRTLVVATIALLAAAAIVGWLAIRSAGRFRLAEELRALA